jgi:hypothetical protein
MKDVLVLVLVLVKKARGQFVRPRCDAAFFFRSSRLIWRASLLWVQTIPSFRACGKERLVGQEGVYHKLFMWRNVRANPPTTRQREA